MVTTHRTRWGNWAVCRFGRYCRLRFHFPGITPVQMALVPEPVLWELCEVLEPPQIDVTGYHKVWQRAGRVHRDYDLPAVIDIANERIGWYQNGRRHRGGGRAAILWTGGYAPGRLVRLAPRQEWWVHGRLVRAEAPQPL